MKRRPICPRVRGTNMNMAMWTVVGIGIGAGMGSATDNMGQCVAWGAALGLVIGAVANRRSGRKSP